MNYYLQLSQTDTTLLVILVVLLSVFFLLSAVAVGFLIAILASVRRVTQKAESVVDSVEAAAEALKQASGPVAVIKMLQNIMDAAKSKK